MLKSKEHKKDQKKIKQNQLLRRISFHLTKNPDYKNLSGNLIKNDRKGSFKYKRK